MTNHTHFKTRRGRCSHGTWWVNLGVLGAYQLPDDDHAVGRLIERLLNSEPANQTLFKEDARSRVICVDLEGVRWVLKWIRVHPVKNWFYHLFRRTPAWREWFGARRLVALGGIRVSVPLALVHSLPRGREAQVLILPLVEGEPLNERLGAAPPVESWTDEYRSERRRLAVLIGEQVGRMLSLGIVNRDHKPANLIVDSGCEQGREAPVVIDPAGLRHRRTERQVCRMLAVMLRTFVRAGTLRPIEALLFLKTVLQCDPTLAAHAPRRLRYVAGRVFELLPNSSKQKVRDALQTQATGTKMP